MACITLLSDFGLQDAAVASVKGLLYQHAPALPVFDISHMAEPYHMQQASYLLKMAYGNFPTGSFHIVLCDVYHVAKPTMVLCIKDGHYFLTPDNGIVPLAFFNKYDAAWRCYDMAEGQNINDWVNQAANIIRRVSEATDINTLSYEQHTMSNKLVHWQPTLIDRFENVIVNLTKETFENSRRGRNFRIQFARHTVTEISNGYADVRMDDILCWFNSTGYLEIAINRGKAASMLGLKLDKEKHLLYTTIKIDFE
jgi:S-adenosylmethionine hydrolase